MMYFCKNIIFSIGGYKIQNTSTAQRVVNNDYCKILEKILTSCKYKMQGL